MSNIAWFEQLGAEWQRSATSDVVLHVPLGLEFVLVTGGTLQMGLTTQDLAEIARHIDASKRLAKEIEGIAESASPVHLVTIEPFLCSKTLVSPEHLPSHFHATADGAISRYHALEIAHQFGLRLPSEAELEWLARDGAQSSFVLDAATLFEMDIRDERLAASQWGVEELNGQTWAADDWHASYQGAPAGGHAWTGGDPCGVTRSGFWLRAMQSEEELLSALAAKRQRGGVAARLRLVRGLGDMPQRWCSS